MCRILAGLDKNCGFLLLANFWASLIFSSKSLHKGASINYVDTQEEGGPGSPKCQRYYIRSFSKLVNKGGQKSLKSVNVNYYGCPLKLSSVLHIFLGSSYSWTILSYQKYSSPFFPKMFV